MTLIITLLLAPWTILTICFAVEVFAGLRPLASPRYESAGDQSAVVIVPAHDEEIVIHSRLLALKRATAGLARIVVVADNCSDQTAEIVRALDVEAIERHDLTRKGKGYALDFARAHLEAAPPAVILIIDADCAIDARSIERLVVACTAVGRPCQATNLQRPSAAASPAVQLSTFAFFIKNVVRQRGLQRLAGRAQLLGTGMAFPWSIFAKADLATGHIVEDLKLGQELAAAGHLPLLVEEAMIWSNAETEINTLLQRSRWEGGFIHNALRVGPTLVLQSVIRADLRALWAAIHSMIPPFALLILMDVAAIVLALATSLVSRIDPRPIFVLAASLLAASVALAAAWRAGGSRFVSLSALCRAPVYILWKIPIYVGFARRGMPREWQRTDRG